MTAGAAGSGTAAVRAETAGTGTVAVRATAVGSSAAGGGETGRRASDDAASSRTHGLDYLLGFGALHLILGLTPT
jgi:hypothetical protein